MQWIMSVSARVNQADTNTISSYQMGSDLIWGTTCELQQKFLLGTHEGTTVIFIRSPNKAIKLHFNWREKPQHPDFLLVFFFDSPFEFFSIYLSLLSKFSPPQQKKSLSKLSIIIDLDHIILGNISPLLV